MHKDFIKYEIVRDNAIKLAHAIYRDNFIPDVIYVSLRGGAYLGNIISEYFKVRSEHTQSKPVLYAAVVARSYSNPGNNVHVSLDGWTYDPRYLRVGDRVLLVDDIYDTGHTIDYLAKIIVNNGVTLSDLRIVVHDFKEHSDDDMRNRFKPDYYARKMIVNKDNPSRWLHYLSHEMVGLTDEEISNYYNDEIAAILRNPKTM